MTAAASVLPGTLVAASAGAATPAPAADHEFYRDWLGTTLVEGQYHLTDRPALLEGAERMLTLGTRVGKFWFEPHRAARDYPWNSRWPEMKTLSDLAMTDYWRTVFALPFRTLFLETHSPSESGWNADHGPDYYARIRHEWEELVQLLYAEHGDKPLTIVLQNWEGDWQLRGLGASWEEPPKDWRLRCERYARRLEARQAAVTRVRDAHPHAQLRVLHAAEVNRVADQWRGIPTLTEHVLPAVELDLVSYSCYDAMADGATLARAIDTIRRYARTKGPLGSGAVCLGEIGIPEMAEPVRIAERWHELLAAARAAQVHWVVQWALYCNEADNRAQPGPKPPVTDPRRLRGFWLYRPDGSLSETGRVLRALWNP
ncbi:MAG TPA: hypothetical protein VK477_14715 [Acidobacteriota bacterium]|nr:hypothetical protein [Acidobacteriota bacterium]